jgi:hypothetical protein
MRNVDDLLNPAMQDRPQEAFITPEVTPEVQEAPQETHVPEETSENMSYLDKFRKDKEEFLGNKSEDTQETEPSENSSNKKSDELSQETKQDDVDEYGNELQGKKTYTEEEVQSMIRKRLRQHHEDRQQQVQQMTPQQQQAAQSFEHNPESEASWEVQLENHIKNTVKKMKDEEVQLQWQSEEQIRQAEFEEKFTMGMQKYTDFNTVVAGKPITNGIMMAARSMKDPAAFVYAASKQHPAELERIAKIQDPYILAAEVGRLEERMKKSRTVSSAPKPSPRVKGDVTGKTYEKLSIEERIHADAKRKSGRR